MKKLKELLQKFFKRTKKEPTLNWAVRVDQWILEDYPHDN